MLPSKIYTLDLRYDDSLKNLIDNLNILMQDIKETIYDKSALLLGFVEKSLENSYIDQQDSIGVGTVSHLESTSITIEMIFSETDTMLIGGTNVKNECKLIEYLYDNIMSFIKIKFREYITPDIDITKWYDEHIIGNISKLETHVEFRRLEHLSCIHFMLLSYDLDEHKFIVEIDDDILDKISEEEKQLLNKIKESLEGEE